MQNGLWELACAFCPVIQVFKHAKNQLVIAQRNRIWLKKQGKIPVFSALAFASASAKFYETYMTAYTAYSIF